MAAYHTQTDLFLLLLPTSSDNRGHQSAKLFEYIASDRPILGVVPPGGSAEMLINAAGVGLTVSDDVEEVMQALEHFYGQWQLNNLGTSRISPSSRVFTPESSPAPRKRV